MSAERKHTPGPWMVRKLSYGCRVVGPENSGGARNLIAETTLEQEPDARLIAAAPELLGACKAVLAQLHSLNKTNVLVEEAIAKAEGRG